MAPDNQQAWELVINPEEAKAMAEMLGAFEFGVRQVYYKAGYTDEEIGTLKNFRFGIGSLTNKRPPTDIRSTKIEPAPIFAYNSSQGNQRFLIDVHYLYFFAKWGLKNEGYVPAMHAEFADNPPRSMHALEFCELAGVEEAAHSLLFEHHPVEALLESQSDEPYPSGRHFQNRAERRALKWKRNYAIRFIPDFAQGFIDFENGLSQSK